MIQTKVIMLTLMTAMTMLIMMITMTISNDDDNDDINDDNNDYYVGDGNDAANINKPNRRKCIKNKNSTTRKFHHHIFYTRTHRELRPQHNRDHSCC